MTCKFYQMSPETRIIFLQDQGLIDVETAQSLRLSLSSSALPVDIADSLIENQIGQFALPLGLVRNLSVNGKKYQVPLAVEEPSVVAAANNGARIANMSGGVTASSMPHRVKAEIIFRDIASDGANSNPGAASSSDYGEVMNLDSAIRTLAEHMDDIYTIAEKSHPSIVKRGGGLRDVTFEPIGDFLKIVLSIDPQAAMGANIVNTIAEAVAGAISEWLDATPLVAILTNASESLTVAQVSLDVSTLATSTFTGIEIAQRIAALSDLACVDVDRAVTHNKGIMNGIASAVLASGNDARAVEAGVHAFASQTGQYMPLSRWRVDRKKNTLEGRIELPLQVGVMGGAMSSLPMARVVSRIGEYGVESTDTLRNVLASLGLVQNLAALRALAGPGIQAGHMKLHARSLAISAGAHGEEIAQVAQALSKLDKNLENAQRELDRIRTEHE